MGTFYKNSKNTYEQILGTQHRKDVFYWTQSRSDSFPFDIPDINGEVTLNVFV